MEECGRVLPVLTTAPVAGFEQPIGAGEMMLLDPRAVVVLVRSGRVLYQPRQPCPIPLDAPFAAWLVEHPEWPALPDAARPP